MGIIANFLSGMTAEPFRNLLELVSLSPQHLVAALVLLGFVIMLNDLVRTALMTDYTRSVLVHVIVNALTLLPGAILGVVLLYAGHRHPERAWINLGLGLALYVAWYLGGTLTWLARQDTEGADVGWMSHGLFLTVPCGVLAALLF